MPVDEFEKANTGEWDERLVGSWIDESEKAKICHMREHVDINFVELIGRTQKGETRGLAACRFELD